MLSRVILKRNFALDNTRTLTRHIQDRVMSTPQWPVPYYNRVSRANPERVKGTNYDISNSGRSICDLDVEAAKHVMGTTVKGREALAHLENHGKIDSYIVRQNDSGNMAKAYSADLVKFLDIANKENKRILSTTNLL